MTVDTTMLDGANSVYVEFSSTSKFSEDADVVNAWVELVRVMNHDWIELEEFMSGKWDARILFGKHSMGLNGFWIQGNILYTHWGARYFHRELTEKESKELMRLFKRTEQKNSS